MIYLHGCYTVSVFKCFFHGLGIGDRKDIRKTNNKTGINVNYVAISITRINIQSSESGIFITGLYQLHQQYEINQFQYILINTLFARKLSKHTTLEQIHQYSIICR